jgi:lysophospholipase L1-like esterase
MRWLVPAFLALALAAPASAAARGTFVVGDSLALGAKPYLADDLDGWRIRTSAVVGRHTDAGIDALRAAERLPATVAVSLGTNDDPRLVDAFERYVKDVLRIAGTDRCIVWATIRRPAVAGTSYSGYNAVLARYARERDNFAIVRWKRMADRHPEWLAADGVHATADGYAARARAYARKLRDCG